MANAGFRQLNGERSQINGLDAYVGTYQGQMQGLGNVVTLAAHIVHERNVYLLAGLAPAEPVPSVRSEQFVASIRSFRELSREEAANIRPESRRHLHRAQRRHLAVDRAADRRRHGEAGDAGDHEQLRADAAAAARRSHQDRRRRLIVAPLYNRALCAELGAAPIAGACSRRRCLLRRVSLPDAARRPRAAHVQSRDDRVHRAARARGARQRASSRVATSAGCPMRASRRT